MQLRRMSKFFSLILCLCVAAVFACVPAQAQVLYGSLIGTVTDQTGAVVPNAKATMTSKDTGLSREATSDEAGRYSFVNMLPGGYDLKVEASGFRPFTKTGVPITINTVTREDVRLEVGTVAEQVTVEASAVMLQTDKSDLRAEIGSKAVTNLPLFAFRNYQSLINLVPGATPAGFQNAVIDSPARALTTTINGVARNMNTTRTDGATNIYIWLPHHTAYVSPVETIDTVNISTNAFDAEQGMAGGAAITVNTKSGTNDLHGVAFWYHDNQHLAARNFFLRTPQKPKSIMNIHGGTLGGPVIKDKLFFFGSYEGMRERRGEFDTWHLPTDAMRTGNFSAYPEIIYDPATGNPDGSGRRAFPGNVIPPARISDIARRIQADAPRPNLPGAAAGTRSNFTNSASSLFDRHNWDAKINWNPSNQHTFFGKYSRMDAPVRAQFAFGAVGGPGLIRPPAPGAGLGDTTVQIATFGHTWTISPTFVADATFGYTRFDQTVTGPDFGKNYGSEVWGIPGTNAPIGPGAEQLAKVCPTKDCYSGMPIINHGFSEWGNTSGWEPVFRNDRSFTFTTNATKVRGGHEFRFGFDLVRHHMDHWQPELGRGPRGYIEFGGGVTACSGRDADGRACASPNYMNQYAAYLLGLPTFMSKTVQFFLMTNREWQFAWYGRDRWQITRNLTLNLGLRYEYYPLITRKDRGIERWDPTTNQVRLGRIGGNPDTLGITVSKRLFAPRVGFAYRWGPNTVIRSGYGITYDPIPFSRPLRGLYPATIAASFPSANSFVPVRTLAEGIPPIPLPDVSSGLLTLPSTVDMGPRSAWGRINRGYIQSWNFIIERKWPAEFVTSIGYVGTQIVHQLADRDINAAAPGTGAAGRPLAATQGRRITANMWDGWLSGNYHALQLAINRPLTKGLLMKGSYTWSKAINMTDENGWASVGWNWGPVIRRNRAPASHDRTHMFTMAWLYELPFGPGKRWAQSGPGSWLVRDWQINGSFAAYTGLPFSVGASGASLNAPGNSQTADQVKANVEKLGQVGPGSTFYDPLAFRAITEVRFGSTGRNTMRGPGMINADLSLFRTFSLSERFKLQFRAEAFNFTNTPKFPNPSANVSDMSLNPDGTIRSLGGFMSITSTAGGATYGGASAQERQLRFGLRLSF